MERTMIGGLAEKVGQSVRIQAWVQVIRDHGRLKFLVLRDRTGTVQAVAMTPKAEDEAGAPLRATLKALTTESVVDVIGTVREEPQAPGGFELSVENLTVLSLSEPELPIPVFEKGGNEAEQSLRLDYRWLDLRKPENLLIFKTWTAVEAGYREALIKEGFLEIHSPKLMAAASESGAEVFEVKYFDTKAYLAQSPQFYKQMAMAAGFEKVFEVGAVYRAEHSFTTRHATEFTGFDFEQSFIENHEDVMGTLERTLTHVLQKVHDELGEEIKEKTGQDVMVPTLPFPRITLAEAKKLLEARGVTGDKAGDLSPEEERTLSEIIKEQYGHDFIFVTEYPHEHRAFYHMRLESDHNLTKGYDLLYKGVEITTGAQREHRYEILKQQALEKGLTEEGLREYLNFFRFGCPPHGGAGIGPGRLIMKLLGCENIREVAFLHRGVNRLTP